MLNSKDVINRAYGSIAKECSIVLDFNFYPTYRGIKYYWYILIRKFTR